jgi:hypothetical protein
MVAVSEAKSDVGVPLDPPSVAGVPQFVGISRDSRRRFPCKLTG